MPAFEQHRTPDTHFGADGRCPQVGGVRGVKYGTTHDVVRQQEEETGKGSPDKLPHNVGYRVGETDLTADQETNRYRRD